MPVVSNRRSINKLLDSLDKQSDDLFAQTYHSTDINRQMLSKTSDELNASIRKAIQGDSEFEDLSNTTKLYQKAYGKKNGSNVFGDDYGKNGGADNIMSIFQNNELLGSLMETYSNTKWIKLLDDEIDMCVKYMPKIQTALNIVRDNVLCSDSFNQSIMTASPTIALADEELSKFTSNDKNLMELYDFEEAAEKWYDTTSKYGEAFVYVVPYKKSLAELLKKKGNTGVTGSFYAHESSTIMEHGKLTDRSGAKNLPFTVNAEAENGCIRITLNKTGMLSDNIYALHEALNTLRSNPICSSMYDDLLTEAGTDKKEYKLDRTIDDVLEYEDDTSADGLVGARKVESNPKIKVPGCVVRQLDRSKLILLYIEDVCLGYYYIKFNMDNLVDANTAAVNSGYNSITSMFNVANKTNLDDTGDPVLKYIAGKISEKIDSAFINSNQELRKEIYLMLKYNDQFNQLSNEVDINITYIPPEDIVHIKFNEDSVTHRGKSDLWDGLIAAKMWIMINTTTVLGNVTRSQDRRVYYVKTMVENNVAKTLLNVIEQLKKGNFGIRQMESINNILSIIGKFNDMVIPVGQSGDSPITFDIMQGQNFELPADLMNSLEDSAIGSICPLEIVNSSQNMDFAIRYTMTNNRLLRSAVKRQRIFSKFLSRIYTKIYNCEFDENMAFTVKLPPPAFLMLTQGSQMIQSGVQYIDGLADIEMNGEPDEDRNQFRRLMLHQMLPSYIDLDMIEMIKEKIKLEKSIEKTEKEISPQEG